MKKFFLFLQICPILFLHTDANAFLKDAQNYTYFLTVCTVFKNEAPYLKEWIEYNKIIGVEKFLLYNNGSTDNYKEILDPYIINNEVTLMDWPTPPNLSGSYAWVYSTQWPAFVDAIKRSQGVSQWLAIIDIDEFILPLHQDTLVDFLLDYDDFAGVVLNWYCFGTSGIKDIPQDKLMIEMLTQRAETNHELNFVEKTIVRPEYVDTTISGRIPHTWRYIKPHLHWAVHPNKKPHSHKMIDVEKIRINHYIHRTENYLYTSKIAKKQTMDGFAWSARSREKTHKACNRVEDREIFRFIPLLRQKVFGNDE